MYFGWPNGLTWEASCTYLLLQYFRVSQLYREADKVNFQLHQQLVNRLQQDQLHPKAHRAQSQSQLLNELNLEAPPSKSQTDGVLLQKSSSKWRRQQEGAATKKHRCTYPNCQKEYSSCASLNLHIKLKHNGGSKKQREYYAIKKLRGDNKNGQFELDLPPNFLQQFGPTYSYKKKYNM